MKNLFKFDGNKIFNWKKKKKKVYEKYIFSFLALEFFV